MYVGSQNCICMYVYIWIINKGSQVGPGTSKCKTLQAPPGPAEMPMAPAWFLSRPDTTRASRMGNEQHM